MSKPRYATYAEVPWSRRSGTNNLFVFLGLFGALPLTIWTCVNLITGDVYFNDRDQAGNLKTWGIVNKVWAFLFALVWVCVLCSLLYQQVAS